MKILTRGQLAITAQRNYSHPFLFKPKLEVNSKLYYKMSWNGEGSDHYDAEARYLPRVIRVYWLHIVFIVDLVPKAGKSKRVAEYYPNKSRALPKAKKIIKNNTHEQ
jgi:hypothetical protein